MKITNEFQRVYPYLDDYCVTFNDDAVFVLNLTKNRVESTVKYLRGYVELWMSRISRTMLTHFYCS